MREVTGSLLEEPPLQLAHRYEILERLGQGGMGVVYRARDRLTQRLVALKYVAAPFDNETQLELTTSPSSTQVLRTVENTARAYKLALAREFRILSTLRHPNIISVLDYGFDKLGAPFFTMELLDAPVDLLRAGTGLDLSARVELIAQLLRALAYLHRRGLLHRDIKPSNVCVLLSSEGAQLKLLDFGIAAHLASAAELAGTIEYMAPEVLHGAVPSEATDLYSVGVVAYELLTGRFPHDRSSLTHFLSDLHGGASSDHTLTPSAINLLGGFRAIVAQNQQSVFTKLEDSAALPAPLHAVMRRLLHPIPEQRYQDATEVLVELGRAIGLNLDIETAATRESYLQASALIGRDAELAQLDTALRQMVDGHGGTYLLGGESGVGKSRLLDEVRALALVRGLTVLRGQAVSSGGNAYQVFLEPLRTLALDATLEDLETSVLHTLLPDLPVLLGRDIAEAPALEAKATQQRLVRVLVQVLTNQTQPLLLLLEDIHWADPESLSLLSLLIAQLKERPMLIIASYRDDERPDLPKTFLEATHLPLRRLDAADVAALSLSMLGTAGTQPEVLSFVGRETEGNPFFIVEVIRALAEEAGGLEAIGKRTLPRHLLAGGVRAVLERRLRRVPDEARPLLKVAAIAGREIDVKLLAHLEPSLEPWLLGCADAAVLEVSDQTWRFAHDKLRETLLAGLSMEERRDLHRRVAQAMLEVHGKTDATAAALAYHFELAGDVALAAEHALDAGAAAMRRGALNEAAVLLERTSVLQAQVHIPATQRAITLRWLARVQYGMGQVQDCLKTVRAAMELLGQPLPATRAQRRMAILAEIAAEARLRLLGPKPIVDPDERARMQELLALATSTGDTFFVAKGHIDEALLVYLRGLHLAERLHDAPAQTNYLGTIAYAAAMIPMHTISRYYMRRSRAQFQRLPAGLPMANHHLISGMLAVAQGKWQQSVTDLTRSLEQAQRSPDDARQSLAWMCRIFLWLLMGRYEEAERDTRDALARAERAQNHHLLGTCLAASGLLLLRQGQPRAGKLMLERSIEHANQSGSRAHIMVAQGMLAACAMHCGDRDAATVALDAALPMMKRSRPTSVMFFEGYAGPPEAAIALLRTSTTAAERKAAVQRLRRALRELRRFARIFPVGRPRFLLWLGHAQWLLGRPRRALWLLRLSLRLSRKFEMPYEQGLAQLALGELGARTEGLRLPIDRQAARDHLHAAIEIFQRLGAHHELAQAQRSADESR